MIIRKPLSTPTSDDKAAAHDNAAKLATGAPIIDKDTFRRLYGEKVTAESTHRAQFKWMREIQALQHAARQKLNVALDGYGRGTFTTSNAALLTALKDSEACAEALVEAHKDYVDSITALNGAQEAFANAICNTPRDQLAEHMAVCRGMSLRPQQPRPKRVSWPSDAALEQLRVIPHRLDVAAAGEAIDA